MHIINKIYTLYTLLCILHGWLFISSKYRDANKITPYYIYINNYLHVSGDNSGFCVSPQWEMVKLRVKLQTILWNSCDNRCWHTCSTEEDTVFPWPWNDCDNSHGTTVTSSVVRLWQKCMIPLRQQLHHNLKTFYILVV